MLLSGRGNLVVADNKDNESTMVRAEWVEPEVVELNVSETEGFPGRGGDGSPNVDCTRS